MTALPIDADLPAPTFTDALRVIARHMDDHELSQTHAIIRTSYDYGVAASVQVLVDDDWPTWLATTTTLSERINRQPASTPGRTLAYTHRIALVDGVPIELLWLHVVDVRAGEWVKA